MIRKIIRIRTLLPVRFGHCAQPIIMQSFVYDKRIDEMGVDDPHLRTGLDFDECYLTDINRFSCQTVVGVQLARFPDKGCIRSVHDENVIRMNQKTLLRLGVKLFDIK